MEQPKDEVRQTVDSGVPWIRDEPRGARHTDPRHTGSCSITIRLPFWRGGYTGHACMDEMCPAIANGEARL
jgi:hypothetical protein